MPRSRRLSSRTDALSVKLNGAREEPLHDPCILMHDARNIVVSRIRTAAPVLA
jgi:hypothetical protein